MNSDTKLVFVQISDKLMTKQGNGKWIDDYYEAAYKKMPGYYKPEHFMEVPYWIAIISGMASEYRQELHIVTSVKESIERLKKDSPVLLFSAIEANLGDTFKMVEGLKTNLILMGGHVNPDSFKPFSHVKYLDKPSDLFAYLPRINIHAAPDYTLFKGVKVIPRLTLSTGCKYACGYCMVPRRLVEKTHQQIMEQVESFRCLDFELVYLDDKTFSQASNWRLLGAVGQKIALYNSKFNGFIAQTTVNMAAQQDRIKDFKALGIKYLEIGVESLQMRTRLRKPYSPEHLDIVMREARESGIKIIPNFIFGIPGDDYGKIIHWVKVNLDIIPVVNVNFLSVLFGAVKERRLKNLPCAKISSDQDQNDYRKSWLSHKEQENMLQAVRAVYKLTTGQDFYPELA